MEIIMFPHPVANSYAAYLTTVATHSIILFYFPDFTYYSSIYFII